MKIISYICDRCKEKTDRTVEIDVNLVGKDKKEVCPKCFKSYEEWFSSI
jgi:DNA-directed RNA polymerase subunit RPC12/RpoP